MSNAEQFGQPKTSENNRPLTSNLTLEERLKVITNLIVDRIIEDQLNGNLHFKTKTFKQP